MVGHIDDSRERPERAVSDTIREKGGITDDPAESGAEKVAEDTAIRAIATNQNRDRSGSNDEADDDKETHVERRRRQRNERRRNNNHNKRRNKRNNNTLKIAIERAEDKADAER